MRKKWLAVLLAAASLTAFSSCSGEAPVMPEPGKTSTQLQKPELGDDFYGYMNFDYLTDENVDPDVSRIGKFSDIQKQLELDVSDLLDQCAEDTSSKDSITQTVREIYKQYLDRDTREKVGVTQLMPAVAAIENAGNVNELVQALGYLYQEYGVGSFFKLGVNPDFHDTSVPRLFIMGMNTCGNMKENFTRTDAGSEDIGKLVNNTLTALEVDNTQARARASAAARMIKSIAEATLDSDLMKNIELHLDNLYNKEELAKVLSNIDVNLLLESFGYKTDEVTIFDVGQLEKINELFTEDNLRIIKDYTLGCLMFEYKSALPPSYLENFKLVKYDEKSFVDDAKLFVFNSVENEVGVLYGRKFCTDEVMSAANKMMDDIKESCRDLINKCDRLGDDSKKKYLKKLDNVIVLMGYDKDYQSPFEIIPAKDGGNLLGNIIAIKRGECQNNIAKINGIFDRRTWDMTPVTVNAVYNSQINTITIPAVMLSKVMFDPEKGEYYNLGMLGYVLAHELNHAFDANGYKYNENGCYVPDWLNEDDRNSYVGIQEKAVAYYSNYRLLDLYKIDGKMTLAENIADIGAVQCITNITDDKENLEQMFAGIAEQWAQCDEVEDVIISLSSDEHSPAEARVNAVVSSIDKFYSVYDIKETDKMYVAPENRVKVW